MIIFGILIALSMVLSLIVGLGSGASLSNAPVPQEQQLEELYFEPVGMIDGGQPSVGLVLAAPAPAFIS